MQVSLVLPHLLLWLEAEQCFLQAAAPPLLILQAAAAPLLILQAAAPPLLILQAGILKPYIGKSINP